MSHQPRQIQKWIFAGPYTARDKGLMTFLSNRIIQEYQKMDGHIDPLKSVTFQPQPFIEVSGVLAYADLDKDIIKVSVLPDMPLLALAGRASQMAHEIAHHWIEERFEHLPERRKLGNDLVHYALNTKKYQYTKLLGDKRLFLRYGVAFVKVVLLDIGALVRNKDAIVASIKRGEGRGVHELFIR
jgi:hypothetical protein